jgi:glycosyltransferase involved in cell wall biosynthesis
MQISCIICVYNEGPRIGNILKAVIAHPRLSEIIVVNDGSTDDTDAVLRTYPQIHLISYKDNRGKTYAMGQGMAQAKYETIMLLDADLSGITHEDIEALAQPVVEGWSDVSLSLRRNSLSLYRLIGLDFVTGERVIPANLFKDAATVFSTLPRWGAEVFINARIIKANLRIAVVPWNNVYNVRKYNKVGFIKGVLEEMGMVRDALSVLPLPSMVMQHIQMLRRKTSPVHKKTAAVSF